MASEYSPTLYLLDRANIQDTLTNMVCSWCIPTSLLEALTLREVPLC